MPRIEPIPMDQLSEHSHGIVKAGVAAGLYATPVPLQIFAYRSAQLGECEPCSQSRKHDSITDADVACLLSPDHGSLSEPERLAVEFLDLLSSDHHRIDDDFYRRLGEHFTAAQIIELGFNCAGTMGLHRFLHTLDVYGDSRPVIGYSPDQVDSARSAAQR